MSSDLAAMRQGMERDRVRQHTKHGRRHASHGARYRRAEQEYRRNVHQHGQYDETLALDRKQRDPVAPAEPSTAEKSKKAARATENGLPIHSFKTLMAEMGTRCRHRCRVKSDPECPPIFQDTDPTPLQARALELTRLLPVQGI